MVVELHGKDTFVDKERKKKKKRVFFFLRDLPEHLFQDATGPFVHLMLTDKQKSRETTADERRHSAITSKDVTSYFLQLCNGPKESSSVSKKSSARELPSPVASPQTHPHSTRVRDNSRV